MFTKRELKVHNDVLSQFREQELYSDTFIAILLTEDDDHEDLIEKILGPFSSREVAVDAIRLYSDKNKEINGAFVKQLVPLVEFDLPREEHRLIASVLRSEDVDVE